ncbi:hypothetical protein Ddc_19346 [Ditylenchus destructor]|nr:hypothetical protein Ddc_19346 [Ditylenchus destructor]
MFLPSEVLSDVFSSISRQQLADLQLVSREFDSIIDAKIYPLHVIRLVYIMWKHDKNKGLIDLYSETHGQHFIDLDTDIGSAPTPSYLRIVEIQFFDEPSFTTNFAYHTFLQTLARLENAFDGGMLVFNLHTGACKNEHDLRLQTMDVIEKVTPVFHKVGGIRLFWIDTDYISIPMGPEDNINILSTSLLLNCRNLCLHEYRRSTDRLGLVSPIQVVDWLLPDEDGDKEGRYLVLSVNRGAEAILTDLISKKVKSKNERDCEVVIQHANDWISDYPLHVISKRAKSMIERPDDVVVEFFDGSASRIFKYRRRITDK